MFSSQSQVTVHLWWKAKREGSKSYSHHSHSQEQRGINAHVLACLLTVLGLGSPLVYTSGTPAEGMVSPTVGRIFPTSISLIQTVPHSHVHRPTNVDVDNPSRRPFSQVALCCVKLTGKVNYHMILVAFLQTTRIIYLACIFSIHCHTCQIFIRRDSTVSYGFKLHLYGIKI